MTKPVNKILADASAERLCDVVVIGIRPDASVYVDWSGSTIASLMLFLKLAEREALGAWDEGARVHLEAAE